LSYVHNDNLFWDAKGSFWTLSFWKEGFHNFFQSEHQNLFGTIGAHLAGGLFDILGFSAFWLVAILVVMTILSFRGQPLSSAVKSIVAAVALPISSSGILNSIWPDKVVFKGGSMTAGGLIGLYLSGFTESFLNNVGALVLLSAIFIISFMLITHLSLGWLFSRAGIWILVAFRHMGETIRKKRERRKRARKTMVAKAKRKSSPKVKIVKPKP